MSGVYAKPMKDKQAIADFIQQDMSLGEKILQMFDAVLDKLHEIIGTTHNTRATQMVDDLETARSMWFELLEEARENAGKSVAGEGSAPNNGNRLMKIRAIGLQNLQMNPDYYDNNGRPVGWITDREANLKTSGNKTLMKTGSVRLADIMQHDLLYKAYPDMENLQVVLLDGMDDDVGQYNLETDRIELNRNLWGSMSAQDKMLTILHESVHKA